MLLFQATGIIVVILAGHTVVVLLMPVVHFLLRITSCGYLVCYVPQAQTPAAQLPGHVRLAGLGIKVYFYFMF